jgi:hypothetical protein
MSNTAIISRVGGQTQPPGRSSLYAQETVLSPYLAVAGHFAVIPAIAAITYYLAKALALIMVVIVGVHTTDDKRRQACVDIVHALSRGWSRPPRLPGSQ